MISESERIIIDIKLLLDNLLNVQKSIKPDVMNGEPPKFGDFIILITIAGVALDDISKNLKW